MDESLLDDNCIKIDITPADIGDRLDKVLARHLPNYSRSTIQDAIRQEKVTLNGIPETQLSLKLKSVHSEIMFTPVEKQDESSEILPENIPLNIFYEDEHLLVVNKPAGMATHPASGSWTGTLVNALLYHTKNQLSTTGGAIRAGIVHRLDKDTTGIMIVAKNDVAHLSLSRQFQFRSIERAYKAVVWGNVVLKKGTIEGNIARSHSDRKKMTIVKEGGKQAITHWTLQDRFIHKKFCFASLIECKLETGRTHQIRVHLTSIGHSLIGDQTYGGNHKAWLNALPDSVQDVISQFPRQALHAYKLGFYHPVTQEFLQFESELPPEMTHLLDVLRGGEEEN